MISYSPGALPVTYQTGPLPEEARVGLGGGFGKELVVSLAQRSKGGHVWPCQAL